MQSQIASIPPFWQGVVGSLLATIIVAVAVWLYRMQAAQQRRSQQAYEKHVSALKAKLTSPEPLVRIEGYFVALFSLMSYLFLGNLCWILASVISPLVDWPFVVMLDLISLVFFGAGLYWIKLATKMPDEGSSSVKPLSPPK